MAEFRLGRLKFNWRSDWLVNTAYVIDDIVKYGANTYVCKANHTSSGNENLFYQADLTTKAINALHSMLKKEMKISSNLELELQSLRAKSA